MSSTTETAPCRIGVPDILAYGAAMLVPLAVILLLLRPWDSGLDVPFGYGGDSLFTGALVKGVLRNGWWLKNPSLGAPGVMNMYGMPGADTVSWVSVKVLGLLSGDWAVVVNLFYLLGYPAAGLTGAFALRKLGITRLVAAIGGVLFALLPYHWMRGETHLFLAAYWIVPLLALIAHWMDSDRPPLLAPAGEGVDDLRWDVRSGRSKLALAVCFVAAGCGVYYAFFGAVLILAAGLRAAVRTGAKRVLVAALVLASIMGILAVIQIAPNAVLLSQQGPGAVATARNPRHAEVYGLRLTQLLLPTDGHRIASFAATKANYRTGLRQMGPYLDNEGNTAALGVLGVLGFLISLYAFMFGTGQRQNRAGAQGAGREVLITAGFLNVCAFVLATVGGFGAIIAMALPQIRGYNRISVFIAFFSMVAVAVFADRLRARWPDRRAALAVVLLLAIASLAVLDQTPASLALSDGSVSSYREEQAFARHVEDALPEGTAVLQLPYMPFPEPGGAVGAMQDYDPLRAYLHTDGLRWSYGAVKGREDDAWQKATAALPPEMLVREARAKGFGALWVQLDGYEDGGVAMRQSLTGLLGPPAEATSDGTIAVWSL